MSIYIKSAKIALRKEKGARDFLASLATPDLQKMKNLLPN